jgi:cell division protein FtsZ
MVFITCGLGGGTGSGASPIIAEIAQNQGALTIAVVTKPFSFEGRQRKIIAGKALENLKDATDTLLIIPNDKILSLIDKDTTLLSAFWACDEILREAVQGISDLIVLPGIINVDFADVKAIMKNSGPALFGTGVAKGDKRAESAVNQSLESQLLDFSIKGAKGVLFNISAGRDLNLDEIDTIANMITKNVNPKAKIIFGATTDRKLQKGALKITVIATGFDEV